MKKRVHSSEAGEAKHLCILPWIHAQIHHSGEMHPCCRMDRYNYPYGSLSKRSFAEVWNDEPVRKMRREMLEDRPISACDSCYRAEKRGEESFRQTMFREFGAFAPLIDGTREDGSVGEPEIRYLDLRFSNLCNLSCRICSAENSTAWYPYTPALPHGLREVSYNAHILAEIEKLIPGLKKVYFAGGEPLLHEEHYRFLEKMLERGNREAVLTYNTNFSTLRFREWEATALWAQFDRVIIGASLDGVGTQAEILRRGSHWRTIEANFRKLKAEAPRVEFYVHCTVGAANLFHLPAAIIKWIETGMITDSRHLVLNFLSFPLHQHMNVLNHAERKALEEHYHRSLDRLAGSVREPLFSEIREKLLSVLKAFGPEVWEQERENFRRFTLEQDRLRKERFADFFPEHFGLLRDPAIQAARAFSSSATTSPSETSAKSS